MAVPIPESLAVPSVLVSIDEAHGLLRGTPYEPSKSTIRRWIPRHGMFVRRIDGCDYVGMDELVTAHREETAARLRAAARKRERSKS
ncbi:hypothetical protein SSOG_09128 [Streptomyces himastatinicus ATCC 53653]|uniref:Excisionase n=1 Tax=Streptomyces himastatinicus ATCC 53653 TaxID=457427 RepID=D9WWY6_9ACTN|nr:hypothetical protein [Streptomyces himastatinicus]EFL29414.1 hypothetical protein SSOG_09128 [Streptomyces himastatinicus ATCC 53653]